MLGILEKTSPSEFVSNGYISNHNKVRRPRPKFKVSFYLYICCFWINATQTMKTSKEKYNNSFLIVVSSWNRDLMLMLERPLSHYWTSPLKIWLLKCGNQHFACLEPEGHYHNSTIFIENQTGAVAIQSIAIVPFWFSPDGSEFSLAMGDRATTYFVFHSFAIHLQHLFVC